MKLTKSGKIKACCRWSRQYNGELVSKGFSTRHYFMLLDGELLIRGRLRRAKGYDVVPLKFCPNCGAKTEIEGEEKL